MKKIAVIGASKNQNPLIEKAKEMGFETHNFAWKTGDIGETTSDYFYPISILKRDLILEKCREIKPDAIVSVSSNDCSATAAYISNNLGILANSECVADNTIFKDNMRNVLADAGLLQPEYLIINDDFDYGLLDGLSFPIIIKPCDRSDCRGISVANNRDEAMKGIMLARSVSYYGNAIAEEFIDGAEIFCECISYGGIHTVLCYSNIKTTGIPDFSIHRVSQPADLRGIKKAEADLTVKKTLDAIGITYGASHIKLINKDNKIFVIRVSASMASDHIGTELVPLSTGYDYLKAVIEVGLGLRPEEKNESKKIFSELTYILTDDDIAKKKSISSEYLHTDNKDYYITSEPSREMGGYLPLELGNTGEYYKNALRFNSGRTAIWYAIKSCDVKRVWLPVLYSQYVKRILTDDGYSVKEYHISESLCPVDMDFCDGDAVVLVNYYGIAGEQIRKTASLYNNVIIDNSFAFFENPVIVNGVYNVYSCRRFFGVSDGAYLVGNVKNKIKLGRDISYPRMTCLLKSAENGSSDISHDLFNSNEAELGKERLFMSNLTCRILSSIDYSRVKEIRENNYLQLKSLLCDIQKLEIPDNIPAQSFPLLTDGRIRKQLNNLNIHVPTLWRNVITEENKNTYEYYLAENIVLLPIDQRYGKGDMEYLARVVKNTLSLIN